MNNSSSYCKLSVCQMLSSLNYYRKYAISLRPHQSHTLKVTVLSPFGALQNHFFFFYFDKTSMYYCYVFSILIPFVFALGVYILSDNLNITYNFNDKSI